MPRNTPGGGPAPPPALKSKVARTGAPGVNKSPTKKKDAVKDITKVASAAAEGGLDIKELEKRRKELADQLKKCETQIHRLETQYLETANVQGNALKGYENLLSSSSSAMSAKKSQFKPEDRIFSGSSTSGNVG